MDSNFNPTFYFQREISSAIEVIITVDKTEFQITLQTPAVTHWAPAPGLITKGEAIELTAIKEA